jgi:beta-N-acetylglucosaminidase
VSFHLKYWLCTCSFFKHKSIDIVAYKCWHIKFIEHKYNISNTENNIADPTILQELQHLSVIDDSVQYQNVQLENEESDTDLSKKPSQSKQFQMLIDRIKQIVTNVTVTETRTQFLMNQENQEHINNIKIISLKLLLFSVPYGHGFSNLRCFVYKARDEPLLKCDCSSPYSSGM